MDPRDYVAFHADFPDDAQWDAQGNLFVPGGQTIAESLRTQLQSAGFSCSDVFQHDDYGWTFDAVSEKIKVWCLLAAVEDAWLLILKQKKSIIRYLFVPIGNLAFEEFQDKVHEILTGDERFSKVSWYTKSDYDSGKENRGSPSPR